MGKEGIPYPVFEGFEKFESFGSSLFNVCVFP